MLPYKDENKLNSFPIVTILLIILNVVIFTYSLVIGFEDTVLNYGFIPRDFTLFDLASYKNIITSMFLHGSWLHLIGNMMFLYIFGDNVEDKLGKVFFIIVYLLGGIFAAIAQYLTNTSSIIPMIGASGAISALLSSYIIFFPHVQIKMIYFSTNGQFGTSDMTSKYFLLYWFAFQIFSTIGSFSSDIQGGTAYMAHVGGFLFGLCTALLINKFELFGMHKNRLHEFDTK